MKILEIIQEARRNPDLNPKLSAYDQIKARYDRTTDYIDGETKNLFANFMTIEKLGINPTNDPTYSTNPQGIYAYPVDYILDICRSNSDLKHLPYGGTFPYINLFEVDFDNILNVNDRWEPNQFDQIIKFYADVTNQSLSNAKQLIYDQVYVPDIVYDNIWLIAQFVKWPIKSVPLIITKILRFLGYNGVYDAGGYAIHEAIPTQLVILNVDIIKNNQRLLNKGYESGDQIKDDYLEFKKLIADNTTDSNARASKIIEKYIDSVDVFNKFLRIVKNPALKKEIVYSFNTHGMLTGLRIGGGLTGNRFTNLDQSTTQDQDQSYDFIDELGDLDRPVMSNANYEYIKQMIDTQNKKFGLGWD